MLYSDWISILAITAVHLGFATLLGGLIQQIGFHHQPIKSFSVIFIVSALFVASSLSLPLSPISKGIIWLASAIAIVLSGWSFSLAKGYSRWAWHYASFAMTLILLWSLTQAQPMQALSFGLSAGAAALLSLRRGLRAALGKTV